MTPRLRGLAVTALLTLVAGFVGVGLGKLGFERSHHQPTLHDVIHEKLDLTAEQSRRIESLEAEFSAQRKARESAMRAANAELALAIREERGFGPRVTAAVERFHLAMGQLQTEMIRHVFSMREVLNPEQTEIFDNTVVSALTAETQ